MTGVHPSAVPDLAPLARVAERNDARRVVVPLVGLSLAFAVLLVVMGIALTRGAAIGQRRTLLVLAGAGVAAGVVLTAIAYAIGEHVTYDVYFRPRPDAQGLTVYKLKASEQSGSDFQYLVRVDEAAGEADAASTTIVYRGTADEEGGRVTLTGVAEKGPAAIDDRYIEVEPPRSFAPVAERAWRD